MNISGYKWVVPGDYTPQPTPEPTPEPVASCDVINVVKGDTLGAIMKMCEGYVQYGAAMDEYAKRLDEIIEMKLEYYKALKKKIQEYKKMAQK